MSICIKTPLSKNDLKQLKLGDNVLLTGTIYAARDAAHKRMIQMLDNGETLPIDFDGQIIYYVGPCPEKPGQIIGSAGPTTSGRMDAYAPRLIELGLAGMIGKGERTKEVKDAITKHGSVYFGSTGGAGALISKKIVRQEIIAFSELGPEALRRLEVIDFPLIVIMDVHGNNLYETGRKKFEEI